MGRQFSVKQCALAIAACLGIGLVPVGLARLTGSAGSAATASDVPAAGVVGLGITCGVLLIVGAIFLSRRGR